MPLQLLHWSHQLCKLLECRQVWLCKIEASRRYQCSSDLQIAKQWKFHIRKPRAFKSKGCTWRKTGSRQKRTRHSRRNGRAFPISTLSHHPQVASSLSEWLLLTRRMILVFNQRQALALINTFHLTIVRRNHRHQLSADLHQMLPSKQRARVKIHTRISAEILGLHNRWGPHRIVLSSTSTHD